MIYWFSWISDEGDAVEFAGSKCALNAAKREILSNKDDVTIFPECQSETPKTKAEWIAFINNHAGAPR